MGRPITGGVVGRLIALQVVLLGALSAQAQFEVEMIPVEAEGPNSFAAGDVDGDGDVDLVWRDSSAGVLRLSLNDGHGRFRRADQQLPSELYSPVTLTDVDADGDLDLLCAPRGGAPVVVVLNNGRGSFTVGGSTLQGGPAAAAADFDGDRIPDLAVDRPGGIAFWKGTGGALFSQVAFLQQAWGGWFVRAPDLNGDGRSDLLVAGLSSAIYVFVNQGSWRFTRTSTILSQPSQSNPFEVADVDRDGDLDVLSIAYVRSSLWFNDGTGQFTEDPTALPAPVAYSEDAAFADVDEDGDLDLFVGNWYQPDQLYLNDGRGRFTEVTWSRLLPPALPTQQVAAVDLDGDGDVDLVAANQFAPSTLYRNLLRDASFRGAVRIGTTATLRLTARRGFASGPQAGIPALSTRPLLPPLAIPGLGRWWLDLGGLIVLPAVGIPAPAGEVLIPLPVPPDSALVGQTVSAQAVIAHEPDPATWRLTNVGSAAIQ